jgi:hypothetical protein
LSLLAIKYNCIFKIDVLPDCSALGCALTFASEAKFEIEAKILFRLEAKILFRLEAKKA